MKRKREKTCRPAHEQTGRSVCLRSAAHLYDEPFPYYREPSEIGSFSQDWNRQFKNDRSQLRVFSPPQDWNFCSFDLKKGYEHMIKRDEKVEEYINDVLRWITSNSRTLSPQAPSRPRETNSTTPVSQPRFTSLNTDFVCWRGLLTQVMCIPYENRDDLMIGVIYFRGTYFMCEFDTEQRKREIDQMTPQQEQFMAWGYKFEQYVTTERSSRTPDTHKPVNNKEAFTSVVRTRLGNYSLLFGAEVDCEDLNCKTGNKYVELKTSRTIEAQRQYENFCKFKLIKWWAQSFLVGIPRVVCGFRDDEGIVHQLQNYALKDIPGMVKSAVRNPWKPAVCFNFLLAFFKFIKSNITENNERIVYVFKWQPHSDMTWEKRCDDPSLNFLPDWFVKWEGWDKPYTV